MTRREEREKVSQKGGPEVMFKVAIYDKKPILSIKKNGPYTGKMSVGNIMEELQRDPKREIGRPDTGGVFELAKLEKRFNGNVLKK